MKTILLSLILFSSFVFGQFTIDKENGLSDYVVVDESGKSASELYNKTKNWLQRVYKNPDYVTKGDIENQYIRWEGVESQYFCQNKNDKLIFQCHKLKYNIEVSFKDGKYKFDVTKMQLYNPSALIGWYDVDFKGSGFYKNNGEIRGVYKEMLLDVPVFFNDLNNSLKKYIETEETINDNW